MTDHPVSPVCDLRLTKAEESAKGLEQRLDVIEGQQADQDARAARHDERLSVVEEALRGISTTVFNSDKSLAVIAASVEAIKTEVLRINGWQTKLISGLFIVLAILAGVEEAHKIGLI